MSKVITFSRTFPAYHPRKGEPTYFVEKFWNSFNVHALDQDFHVPFEEDLIDLNKNLPYAILDTFKFCLKGRYEMPPKHHTIRAGHRFKAGEYFSPRVWSGKPYNSKQIIIAPDTEIKKVWDILIIRHGDTFHFELDNKLRMSFNYDNYLQNALPYSKDWFGNIIAENDGLNKIDLFDWFFLAPTFKKELFFKGQIICWNENIKY